MPRIKKDSQAEETQTKKEASSQETKEPKAPKDNPCTYADTQQGPGEKSTKVCSRGGIKSELCSICGKLECKGLYYKPSK